MATRTYTINYVALALTVLGALALAAALAFGVTLHRHVADADAAAPQRVTPATAMMALPPPAAQPNWAGTVKKHPGDEAQVKQAGDVVHFTFPASSAALPDEAPLALAGVIKGVAAGQHAVISGSGAGAQAVQRTLSTLGVHADKIVLRPLPEGSSEAAQVDVWLE